jgi:hypothetical protein
VLEWHGSLRWALKDFETCYDRPCVRLVYEAELHPELRQEPFWAKGAGRDIPFTGQGRGEALFNLINKSLISNTFSYEGTLKIHIPHLENVPEELRVGVPVASSEGDVFLKVNDKMDLRLP